MKKKLTKKQRGFVKDYIATGNGTQAALNNYEIVGKDKGNIAAAIATENLSKPHVAEVIEKYSDRIPDDQLLKTHLEGLEATTVRFTPEGEQIDVPDFGSRAKFTDMGYKLKGVYAPDKSITLTLDVPPTEDLKELANALLGQQKHT